MTSRALPSLRAPTRAAETARRSDESDRGECTTTHPFFRFIEAFAAAGITGGCGAGSYCPAAPVSRGEMAVFISVALGLSFQ